MGFTKGAAAWGHLTGSPTSHQSRKVPHFLGPSTSKGPYLSQFTQTCASLRRRFPCFTRSDRPGQVVQDAPTFPES